VRERVTRSCDEAIEAARTIGFPVAMKVLSPDVAHKSSIGGVELRIASAEEAAAAYGRIMVAVRHGAPDASIQGVLVSPMIEGGVEMILGMVHDAVFGPVILVGFGGVFVEVIRDTACRVAPFDINEAHAMLRELKGFPLLNGARGPRLDITALARALVRLSAFACKYADSVESIDINPFLVRRRGGIALVALILPRVSTLDREAT
jgi:hypothetical protein